MECGGEDLDSPRRGTEWRWDDLFIWRDGVSTRVTSDGGENTFNKIMEDKYSLWFSPDGEYLAFLRYNETGIPASILPRYMAGQEVAPPHPDEKIFKYTKPGDKLPIVTFHLLEVNNPSVARKVDIQTYTQIIWSLPSGNSRVVRGRNATDGWLDRFLAKLFWLDVPGLSTPSYLDILDHSGWAHIYLYPVAGGEPIALTSGNWEVTTIYSIDIKRGLVYYQSTERDSTERHIFSVSLDGKTKNSLVDITKEGYYDASFFPGGGYYILSYRGPNLPWQELRSTSPDTPIRVIDDNASLKKKLSEYDLPKISWSTLKHPDGYELNFMERLPPKFRKGVKYPVLFYIYGGPGSQETAKTFRQTIDIYSYLGSDPELEYIVVTVDNRGTGFKGRKFRSLVTGQLGKLEAEDQIAIWGWSYGGYLTGKVLELDSGVFSLGIMTAPVTD
ncbi:unnamed protein product [Tuber melanosporum]|uniref:dipeptidyl-peptidase IV n=1 Tax=Tuber melanosporum (strain Mel28) TaxID=656061 RepID=D5G4W5_TUBMM|nr:uncharacterized protein GSTUM_00000121001 [Tuber melanosporum]CAZ79558.1 unnamed protein product [Tuber melanosporum]